MRKRHNPGCPCCTEPDCSLRCLFPCVGVASELPGGVCPAVCGLRIQVPSPDTDANLSGPGCPPPGLGCTSHPCFACYHWDNTAFLNTNDTFVGMRDFVYNVEDSDLSDCANMLFIFERDRTPCWNNTNSECPDPPLEEFPISCVPERWVKMRLEIRVTWDGSCGAINALLINEVELQECLVVLDPISGLPMPLPTTTYTYEFERTWCGCANLLGALSYIGVTSENNVRGITVDDPCNLASATVTLIGTGVDGCERECSCYECGPVPTSLGVSGATFTGSLGIDWGTIGGVFGNCMGTSAILPVSCGDIPPLEPKFQIQIICGECNNFKIRFTTPLGDIYDTPSLDCTDTLTFTLPADIDDGCWASHTLTLS